MNDIQQVMNDTVAAIENAGVKVLSAEIVDDTMDIKVAPEDEMLAAAAAKDYWLNRQAERIGFVAVPIEEE